LPKKKGVFLREKKKKLEPRKRGKK